MTDHETPIDFALLCAATEGDKVLQKEVLTLFYKQLPHYLKALGNDDEDAVKAAAHRLRGASQAIGAVRLASMAKALECGSYKGRRKDAIAEILVESGRLKAAISAFRY